jgi:hypothetical protein
LGATQGARRTIIQRLLLPSVRDGQPEERFAAALLARRSKKQGAAKNKAQQKTRRKKMPAEWNTSPNR